MSAERGICGGCGRPIGLRMTDGMIRVHGPHHAAHCPGSERPPVPEPVTKQARKDQGRDSH